MSGVWFIANTCLTLLIFTLVEIAQRNKDGWSMLRQSCTSSVQTQHQDWTLTLRRWFLFSIFTGFRPQKE